MKRSVYWIILFAFLLRLGLGVTASVLLPQVGYILPKGNDFPLQILD